jgi:4-diphosphocytidyl-2-C-methyl-D-erythritol kinase
MRHGMQILAPAKINLNLHIGAPFLLGEYKNYHPLDSLVVFADYGDIIEIKASNDLSLEIIGEFAKALKVFNPNENLIIKAARALMKYANQEFGAKIILEKNLPIASGIGGGSSDCAAALLGLNQLWEIGLSLEELILIGNKLGADIGVCLAKAPKIMRNIGDVLVDAPLMPTQIPIILANPLIDCSTPLVYKKFDELGNFPKSLAANYFNTRNIDELIAMLLQTRNDLTHAAIDICPQIGECLYQLGQLPDVKMVQMSGSGASCFAIFDNLEQAQKANSILLDKYHQNQKPIWAKSCNLLGQ